MRERIMCGIEYVGYGTATIIAFLTMRLVSLLEKPPSYTQLGNSTRIRNNKREQPQKPQQSLTMWDD